MPIQMNDTILLYQYDAGKSKVFTKYTFSGDRVKSTLFTIHVPVCGIAEAVYDELAAFLMERMGEAIHIDSDEIIWHHNNLDIIVRKNCHRITIDIVCLSNNLS